MRSRLIIVLVLLAGGVAGYAGRAVQDELRRLGAPASVPEFRLQELARTDCPASASAHLAELRLAKDALSATKEEFADLRLEGLPGSACSVQFYISYDSYYQGRLAVRRDEDTHSTRLDFYGILDTELLHTDRPTFSVWVIGSGRTRYVFESLSGRLFVARDGAASRLAEVGR